MHLQISSFTYPAGSKAYEISFKNEDNKFIFACENNGKCEQITWERETGTPHPAFGAHFTYKKAVRVLDSGELQYADVPVCKECYLPINTFVAEDLNRFLRIVINETVENLLASFDDLFS